MQTTYAKLLFQTDGNLVLYKRNPFGTSLGDTGVWASHTSGVGYRFTIDGSGHIVIFNRSNEMVWMANLELGVPPGLSFDELRIAEDCSLVAWNAGQPVWSFNGGFCPSHV